ncbi:MAG: hypothetical protein ACOZCK_08010 [Pseudomonadota bacterium]
MKRHLILAALIAVAGMATGCATSSGTKVEASSLSFIQKGKTTKSELVSKLGQPDETGVDSNGKETVSWIHSNSRTDAKTFIPIAGMFIGGATTDSTALKVILDKRGVVSDYEYTGGRQVSKLGS